MMDTTPPPFFKRGLPPLARLVIFLSLSIVLMVVDRHYGHLEALRQALAVVVNPLQHAVSVPIQLAGRVGAFFVTQARLQGENARLKQKQLELAGQMLQFQALQAENTQLRRLLDAQGRQPPRTLMAEIIFAGRDPFSRKVMVDRGSVHGVEAGLVVADDVGVVGQVTRVYPLVSEVTLITDKDQAVPVQSLRNGLRAVVYGHGKTASLDLPFMPNSADLEPGDRLVTSGIDGVYPPGLPVAVVSKVERNAAFPFARITAIPSAGVENHRQVLILGPVAQSKVRLPETGGKEGDVQRSR